MDAQAIKTLGGICQILGVLLVVWTLLNVHEYLGHLGWVTACLCCSAGSRGGRRNGDGSQVGGDGYLQRDHDGANGCAGHGTGGEGGAQV